MDETTFTGVLSDVVRRITRQGRGWATATVQHTAGFQDLQIFPDAYAALRGAITDDAFVAVGVRPPGTVTSMTIGGRRWDEPPFSRDHPEDITALLAERNLPHNPENPE